MRAGRRLSRSSAQQVRPARRVRKLPNFPGTRQEVARTCGFTFPSDTGGAIMVERACELNHKPGLISEKGDPTMQAKQASKPPDPVPPGPTAVPSTVWFGPLVPPGVARELIAFLGAHHGVAVLHWRRDARHVEHL